MSQLPNKICIGYQDLKVIKSDLLDAEGSYSADRSEIRIKDSLEGRESLNTLLHEILHAICYVYGLKNDFRNDDQEEKIVNALGNGLTETLLRNPKLVEFIVSNV